MATVTFVGAGSAQTTGQSISITQTATVGNTVHTYSGAGLDMVKLWASNTSSVAVLVNVEWGNATAARSIIVSVPGYSVVALADRKGLGNGTVAVFAATTAVIACWAEIWNSV